MTTVFEWLVLGRQIANLYYCLQPVSDGQAHRPKVFKNENRQWKTGNLCCAAKAAAHGQANRLAFGRGSTRRIHETVRPASDPQQEKASFMTVRHQFGD
jgi:hypothetical protein